MRLGPKRAHTTFNIELDASLVGFWNEIGDLGTSCE